jgi:hypothetical protein
MIHDNMRGISTGGNDQHLIANLSDAEASLNLLSLTATGFDITSTNSTVNTSGLSYIYIAIRRGPMKVPTTGTRVFTASAYTPSVNTVRTTNFPVDMTFSKARTDAAEPFWWLDRLRGYPISTGSTTVRRMASDSANAETTGTSLFPQLANVWNAQYTDGQYLNGSSSVFYLFGRAPGFFDEVCYTGTGSATTQAHNLGVAPELMIVKSRNATYDWAVYSGNRFGGVSLNSTAAYANDAGWWSNTNPTASVLTVGNAQPTNNSGTTYAAYLFATCPGVSKVGSYTGTGTTQTINCGFTAGARFVLIKRTDSTGDWYVWDSARGIVAGNDPYLLLNSTAAEVTSTDYVDTYSAGFEISSTAPAAINASGGTFIFLAIA